MRDLRPLHQPALRQHDVELVDAVEVLGLGEQHQLGVAARADERERLQQVPVGEVLARGHQLALVLRAALGVQPPPGRVDLQERVLDEVTSAHAADYRSRRPPAGPLWRRRPARWIELSRARRAALAVLVDVPGWSHPPHRGARARARAEGATRPASSRRSTPTTLSRRLHRGARPQRHPTPDGFVSLGRTFGIPANGAVSNMALTPHAVFALRDELREGGYDVLHIHEPVVPIVGWDALCSAGELPLVGTFHTYSENPFTNGVIAVGLGGRRRMNRLHVRIAVSEAAAWTARRFYGGRYRIVPNGVHIPGESELARAATQAAGGQRDEESCASCSSARRSSARACRSCCAPSRRCATTCRRRSRSSARRRRRSRT